MMKKYCSFLVFLFFLNAVSCEDKATDEGRKEFYTVNENTGVKVRAIGIELDPHFFSYCVGHGVNPCSEEDWNVVVDRVKTLNIQMFRVMVQPQWFESVNDDDDPNHITWSALKFDTPEMLSLYYVLDLAQQNGISVLLVLWGCPQGHFLALGNQTTNEQSWIVGPKDEAEYAENFSILLQHLIKDKGYTCIKEITPFNEPNYSYFIDGEINTDSYVSMCKKLDAKFKADNIRDRVDFNLADESNNFNFLSKCAENLSSEADLLNSHMYTFGYETPNENIFNFENRNKSAMPEGLPHFIGEFGTNQQVGSYLQADIDLYNRGILIVRMMLNIFNAGGSGMCYWNLFDEYYWKDAPYDGLMKCGLWRYKKESYAGTKLYDNINTDFQVRPQYFAYGLMTSHIRPGADIYPIKTDKGNVAASAFRNPDGKWIYVLTNEQPDSFAISLYNLNSKGEYDAYKYIESELPPDDSNIQSTSTVTWIGDKLDIELEANSILLLHQK